VRGSKTNFENGYIPRFGVHDYTIESLRANIIESNPSINTMIDYFIEHSIQSFSLVRPFVIVQ
jgi:hypothetical protein